MTLFHCGEKPSYYTVYNKLLLILFKQNVITNQNANKVENKKSKSRNCKISNYISTNNWAQEIGEQILNRTKFPSEKFRVNQNSWTKL